MRLLLLLVCFAVMLSFSCTQQLVPVKTAFADSVAFQVVEVPEWDSLFYRTSAWVGADGIYTIPLTNTTNSGDGSTDTATLVVFSDTVLGEIDNNTFSEGFRMINNSVAVIKGRLPKKDELNFYWRRKSDGSPASVLPHQKPEAITTTIFGWVVALPTHPKTAISIFLLIAFKTPELKFLVLRKWAIRYW